MEDLLAQTDEKHPRTSWVRGERRNRGRLMPHSGSCYDKRIPTKWQLKNKIQST